MPEMTEEDQGTALVEILIVIALSSLLIGLFLHADLAVNRSIMRWTYRVGLEQAAIGLGRQFRRDLDNCDSLHISNLIDMEIFGSGTPVVVYSFGDSTIKRNGRLLLPGKIMVADFSLKPLNLHLVILPVAAINLDQSTQVLTITLRRGDLATQTLVLPVRPYSKRCIE